MDHIIKLTKDLKAASITLSAQEARYLVDAYYIIQEDRKRSDSQVRSMGDEPHEVLAWFAEQNSILEKQIQRALDAYSASHPVGTWMRSVKGIGPVLAAGLLAHLDIYHPEVNPETGEVTRVRTRTVGHWWSFGGVDSSKKWEKGKKRPWNATLKTLLWKASDCFVKVSGGENPGYYGAIYRNRKAYEIGKNEAGEYAEQAKAALAAKRFGEDTEAHKHYSKGKLPPGHIDARAKRYAVKLFLSHLHDVWYRHEFKEAPPMPYPIAHLEHVHYIQPPA
jgi:hypothetical protein